ncbi:MAG: glycogen debranching protein GlgX [Paracoccaceae bacterium]|jgi:isoamylase
MKSKVSSGSSAKLGAVADAEGVNFAVFSAHAEQIEVCLFDEDDRETRIALPARSGDIWHGHVRGLAVGQRYGYRAHGPWVPREGHLFNPAKLLIDPYARALDRRLVWDDLMTGHRGLPPLSGGMPCPLDSAPVVPRSIVIPDRPASYSEPVELSLIYEAHVKGLTARNLHVAAQLRGTYSGLTSLDVVSHLRHLGVSHLELLPVAAFLDDRHVIERGLVNYWGYQPIAMMAPEPRYAEAGQLLDLTSVFQAYRQVGIGVILDVVFNHTGEGDEKGPTLCYRGLDNKSYYALTEDGNNLNYTGTGNTLNVAHPMVLRLVMDALRHWAALGASGFRFDLAPTLLRGPGEFEPGSAFLSAVSQDPILNKMIMIAEPWDLGPDGYRLGRFPALFGEWNDLYRDAVRRYWRGDRSQSELARRLNGSAELFDKTGRTTRASVNYLAAHDGFSLHDVVSYREKHNLANGEDNHDGHHDNCSDNLGVEGADAPPKVVLARQRRKRAMLATLFLSQGVPMILAGDEFGRSQQGNNNAYAQDNPTNWLDWQTADRDLAAFVARLSKLRRETPILRQAAFLHGEVGPDGKRNLVWRMPSGGEPRPEDWETRTNWALACEMRMKGEETTGGTLLAVFNVGSEVHFQLPDGEWTWLLESAEPRWPETWVSGSVLVPEQSVQLFLQPDPAEHEVSKND